MTSSASKPLPTPQEFENQLLHFINVVLLGGGTAVDRDTRLFEDGYMNSLRILDLIAVVEKTLGRRVSDRSVRLANFRTVATIVEAFHPDAAPRPAVTADQLFKQTTDRSHFTSPINALQQSGDLHVTDAGQVALTGLALEVLEAVDLTVTRWAKALGAPEHRYPSLIDVGVLERAGQAQSPTTVLGHPEASAEGSSSSRQRALSPAVCYHAYPEWSGKTLGTDPALLTARGHCYRYEDGNHIPLERLWEFTMREIIVLGTREQVEGVRQSLVRHVSALVELLELDASIETATDPFFSAGDEGRRLMQQAGALKYELRLTIDPTGRSIAAASFNHHYDFFGTRFGIQLENQTSAHTGCVAFGLERWVLALLAQHGVDLRAWPTAARDWLDEARRHSTRGVAV